MSIFDLILILLVLAFGLAGYRLGVIHSLGALAGTVLGAALASRFFAVPAAWLSGLTGLDANLSKVIIFVLIFIIVTRIVGLLFWVVDKFIGVLTRLPFINSLNRLLGFLLGLLEGALTLGVVIFFIERFPLSPTVMNYIANSSVAAQLSRGAAILWPFLPDAIRLLQSTIDYVRHVFTR